MGAAFPSTGLGSTTIAPCWRMSAPHRRETSAATWLAASPNTRCCRPSHSSASLQALARPPTTKDLPVPAGPTRDSTRAPEHRHAAHGGGLVDAELDPGLGKPVHERLRLGPRDPGPPWRQRSRQQHMRGAQSSAASIATRPPLCHLRPAAGVALRVARASAWHVKTAVTSPRYRPESSAASCRLLCVPQGPSRLPAMPPLAEPAILCGPSRGTWRVPPGSPGHILVSPGSRPPGRRSLNLRQLAPQPTIASICQRARSQLDRASSRSRRSRGDSAWCAGIGVIFAGW